MGSNAQRWYPEVNNWDGVDPSTGDVLALETTAPATSTGGGSADFGTGGLQEITVDPLTTNAAAGVASKFGWAIDILGASGMDSTATAKRVLPAGTWSFQGRLTASPVASLNNVSVKVYVYRVAAPPSTTRTLLFSAAESGALIPTAGKDWVISAASQPEFLLEADETIQTTFTLTGTGQLGGLFIHFLIGTPAVGNVTQFDVPTPGIRTRHLRTQAITALGTAVRGALQLFTRKTATAVGTVANAKAATLIPKTATATGTVVMARQITAFRVFTATATGTAAAARRVGRAFAATAIGTAAFARRITAARTFTATATGSPVMARTITAFRTFATTAVGTAGFARALIAARTFTATAIGTAAMARRITAFRTFTATAIGTAAAVRRVNLAKAATAIGSAAFARTITAFRTFAATAIGTPGYARALIFGRVFTRTATGTPKLRLDIPEEALDRIIPAAAPDWPLNTPTKTIAGVTRDSAGAIVVSATVKLIRQSDDVTVATMTSHGTTGAYSFTRGGDDPNTYRALATKADTPEIHGVTDVLTPA